MISRPDFYEHAISVIVPLSLLVTLADTCNNQLPVWYGCCHPGRQTQSPGHLYQRCCVRQHNINPHLLASVPCNGVMSVAGTIFEQLSLMYSLPLMFIASFTVCLPYLPACTLEKLETQEQVSCFNVLQALDWQLQVLGGSLDVRRSVLNRTVPMSYHGHQYRLLFPYDCC